MNSIDRIRNVINLTKIDKLPLNFELLGETDIHNLSIKPSRDWKPKKYKPWYLDSDNLRNITEEDKNIKREDEWGVILTFPPKTDPNIMLVYHIIKLTRKGSKDMRSSKFTEEQIAFALKQAETGIPVKEVLRMLGITEQTFYRWKKKYGGMMPSDVKKLKQLEEENRQLKKLVADLSLDKQMLQDVLSKKF